MGKIEERVFKIVELVIMGLAFIFTIFALRTSYQANETADKANEIAMENLRPQLVVQDFTINKNLDLALYAGSKITTNSVLEAISVGTDLDKLLHPIELNAGHVTEIHRIMTLEKELEKLSTEMGKPDLITSAYFDGYYLLYDYCASSEPVENRVLILDPLTVTLSNSGMPINIIEIITSRTLKRDGSQDPRFVQGGSSSSFFVSDNEKIEIPIAFMLPAEMVLPNSQQQESGIGLIGEMLGKSLPLYSHPESSGILRSYFDIEKIGISLRCTAEDGKPYYYVFYLKFDRANGLLERIYIEYDGDGNTNWEDFNTEYNAALSTDKKMSELLLNANIGNPDRWQNALYERNPDDYSKNEDFIHGFDKLISKMYDTYIRSGQWEAISSDTYVVADAISELERDYIVAAVLDDCGIIEMNAMGMSFAKDGLDWKSYLLYILSSGEIMNTFSSEIDKIAAASSNERESLFNQFKVQMKHLVTVVIAPPAADLEPLLMIIDEASSEDLLKIAEQLNLGYWQSYHYWINESENIPYLDIFFAKIYSSFNKIK